MRSQGLEAAFRACPSLPQSAHRVLGTVVALVAVAGMLVDRAPLGNYHYFQLVRARSCLALQEHVLRVDLPEVEVAVRRGPGQCKASLTSKAYGRLTTRWLAFRAERSKPALVGRAFPCQPTSLFMSFCVSLFAHACPA